MGTEWLLVVAYDFMVDARAFGVMTETFGGIMGNLPGLAVVGFTLLIGLVYTKRAGRSLEQYFLSGRKLPWWLLGTSMVATTFSTDTPPPSRG